jgi:putative SOS response-associated peptidase YedK
VLAVELIRRDLDSHVPVPGGKTKQLWRTIVNSREDKLKGRAWSKAFRERRCLFPAAAFYEWTESPAGKVPLRFERPGDEWLWIAGIWDQDKERGDYFWMITTEPNSVLEPVHDRMPAVLAESQISPFLSGELNEFGPSSFLLQFNETENFLKRKPDQGGGCFKLLVPDPRISLRPHCHLQKGGAAECKQ